MKYYHCSDISYYNGNNITKQYKLDNNIISIYKDITNLDVSNIIYMLDYINEDYMYEYNYCYEVIPNGNVFKGYMDYSPLMCKSIIDDVKDVYSNEHIISIIKLFANAYGGDVKSKESLLHLQLYDFISDKIEYICNSARVVNIINQPKNMSLNEIYHNMSKLEDYK